MSVPFEYRCAAYIRMAIDSLGEDYPATRAKLASMEDYIISCAMQQPKLEKRSSYMPKGEPT